MVEIAAAEKSALFLLVVKVPSSSFGPNTSYAIIFRGFSQPRQADVGVVP
jgi:hypothetical protein